MKVEINISVEQIAKDMTTSDLVSFLANFDEDIIADAIVELDSYSGNWTILDRMTKFVSESALETDIELGLQEGYISKQTFDILSEFTKKENNDN